MYQILKNGLSMWIIDTEPTPEQLDSLNCDSYEEYVEPMETYDAKKIRVIASLISTPDISTVDFEGVTFTDKEIGDIILERVFDGNPHGQSAMLAKTNAYLLSVISWEPNEELIDSIIEKQSRINEVREKFNLSTI